MPVRFLALALVLIAASMSTMYLKIASDGFAHVRGVALQMPIASLGLIIGGLTLAGAAVYTADLAASLEMVFAAVGWLSRSIAIVLLIILVPAALVLLIATPLNALLFLPFEALAKGWRWLRRRGRPEDGTADGA